MSDQWSVLAREHAALEIGYSNDLYETILAFGVRRGATLLDVGCGTANASEPFARNGLTVTGVDTSDAMLDAAAERLPQASFVKGEAEALPFPDERFDLLIAAQTFHWVDRARALAEAYRVLRPGGVIAIWWKNLMAQDPMKQLRDEVSRTLGKEPIESGLTGGFREFYASDFKDQTLRVLPWRIAVPVDEFLKYERTRGSLRQALGANAADEYYRVLEQRVRARFGASDSTLSLAFVQYLYLGKKP